MAMTMAARPIYCELQSQKSEVLTGRDSPIQKLQLKPTSITDPSSSSSPDHAKIVLQPRLCTLRSYRSDRTGLIRFRLDDDKVSPFFATLSEYMENSKKTQDIEIISGRLAMMVFAATVTMEVVTGNSLFQKVDLQGIEKAAGVCLGAVVSAAVFAWFTSARKRVGRIFTVGCNKFIDSLIDNLVVGLFSETELSDWSDDI
ncbi:stress enhanced protein 2, chloroplastic [Macadamia integrifolia]|uniref:stress enhanced protein 2, chloroplastic n=1 Tax=Macadamia integrifolia TaxID=60698 RepID=UPI001C4E8B1A|nr:stress enhanced protein 2, chloroplastic [Macadamia integrifolia]